MQSRCTPFFLTKLWEDWVPVLPDKNTWIVWVCCLRNLIKTTYTVFLLSSRNTNGSLGELAMLKENELTGECFQRFFEFFQTSTSVSMNPANQTRRISILLDSNMSQLHASCLGVFCPSVSLHCCITLADRTLPSGATLFKSPLCSRTW